MIRSKFLLLAFSLACTLFPGCCLATKSAHAAGPINTAPDATAACIEAPHECRVAAAITMLVDGRLTEESLRKVFFLDEFVRSEQSAPVSYSASGYLRDSPPVRFSVSVHRVPMATRRIRVTLRLAPNSPCINLEAMATHWGWSNAPVPPVPLHGGSVLYMRDGRVEGTDVSLASLGAAYPCLGTISFVST